jgi:NRPS condensation-like uncharacterized protein
VRYVKLPILEGILSTESFRLYHFICGREREEILRENTGSIRPLRGLERYFYRRPNANVIMVARIKGLITRESLFAASAELRKRYPLLGVRIALDSDGKAWFSVEGVPDITIEVIRVSEGNSSMWLTKASEEQQHLFPLDKGPLIRFILLQSDNSADLVINCHHSVCDGLSLVYLIRDIIRELAATENAHSPQIHPITSEHNLPEGGSLALFQRAFIWWMNRIWERKHISFDEADYQTLHRVFWQRVKGNRILSWALTNPQTTTLVSRCKSEEVSVNSAIVTAFLAAQHELQDHSLPYFGNISMPVNIRSRLTPSVGEDFGLYFSSFKTRLVYDQKYEFWRNARSIHGRVKQLLSDSSVFTLHRQMQLLNPTLIDSMYFTKYGVFQDRFARFFLRLTGDHRINTSMDISNLGRYDFPVEYGSLRLEGVVGPTSSSDFQEKYVGVITIGGRMFFTFTYWENLLSDTMATQIKEVAMSYLENAVGW